MPESEILDDVIEVQIEGTYNLCPHNFFFDNKTFYLNLY